MELTELIKRSGDSKLDGYKYSDGVLAVKLIYGELEHQIQILIKTDSLIFDHQNLQRDDKVFRTCRIETIELKGKLSIENGFYVPSSNFSKFMQEVRSGFSLAYGRKASEVKFLFSLIGYGRLVSCTISGFDQIDFNSLDSPPQSHPPLEGSANERGL